MLSIKLWFANHVAKLKHIQTDLIPMIRQRLNLLTI